MTSSLRNSIHRRNHKERSQLSHRAKLGFLEKHKDYVKRAKDYHSKQDRLTRLKQKAAERNKDEFYFAMTKEKTKGGVHLKDRGSVALPTDVVKVLKTQDENYVRTMRAANLKKIDKIKTQLSAMVDLTNPDDEEDDLGTKEAQVLREAGILPSQSRKGRKLHVVFVDDDDDVKNYAPPSKLNVSIMDGDPNDETLSDLGWVEANTRRPSKLKPLLRDRDVKDKADEFEGEETHGTSSQQHKRYLLKELSARLARDSHMRYAEREFEMQRLMMGKGARQKIRAPERFGGDSNEDDDEDALDARGGRPRRSQAKSDETYKPRVYKWHVERKR